MKKKLKENAVYVGLVIILIIVLYYFDYINMEEQITLTSIGSGLIAIIGLYFFYKRLKNQDKQIQHQGEQISLQIKQRVDERFNSAITLLGSSETSARTGAVYALHELALEEEKYRQQIVQILCSHIRSKTNEVAYQETYTERPSNEIQTTLNLLFKERERGLYTQDFAKVTEFSRADLSRAYLVQANFRGAQCQEANFWFAQCQGANFRDAQCQGASFSFVQCQGANFGHSRCQRASFSFVQCQGVNFGGMECQGASFMHAQCQGAYFGGVECQGTDFGNAQCQGARFNGTQCQGAYAFEKFISQELSSRVGKNTEFIFLQLEGEIDEDIIENIENAKNYLNDFKEIQEIIKDNTGKKTRYGTPEDCITGILENSEQLQSIIEKDWKLSLCFFD
ncbi:pentapeptide repeat-containing protein [bacterium endosymbiont of Bathymodiolus sp. 5 South]|uniref:pentapeptide repeat-containing protein n=1 Tax=bacterium endosymbiont of Bathymodiolus sp. 5 South TaxID=1181670 RepID=UPI00111ACC05|nr:pentapeptide repeat-containing protein [bacterium endosymbiont of Bathymodiolus sp. 5 South]VVH63987.1 hypothetical protein BSPWISOX_433 [uncultured Gammaproteobacteria bacterium]